ncbi:hypothetical protein [Psychrobacter sp. JCM 18900]|uniref:hypothetical protein n=1 Tax=Psychrobacter sp. JCM 18900 TaxID=1298608 RepID=UPI00043218F5|nr:hypothetical protein [Psychrobacter sp. JCM 18900]GAF52381.1 hypothetical protein JCM18900_1897 [Psychrobacter sp. JCM 18900]
MELTCSQSTKKTFNVYLELLTCFGDIEDNVIKISSEQQATDELKSRVAGFVEKYADNHPILNRLKRKIVNLSSSEYFLVLESVVVETSERLKLETYISTLNNIENITDLQSKFEEKMNALDNFSGDLLSKYNLIIPRNDRKTTVGNAKKENRCCRFCNKTMRDGVTFKKVAHAIPEGLGNKNIILGDECDNCNEFFWE